MIAPDDNKVSDKVLILSSGVEAGGENSPSAMMALYSSLTVVGSTVVDILLFIAQSLARRRWVDLDCRPILNETRQPILVEQWTVGS